MEPAKMMRSANAICLVVAFIVAGAGATFTTAAAAAAAAGGGGGGGGGGAPAPPAPASPAAVGFLRGQCSPDKMPEKVAGHCYDSLLPQAGTFKGNGIKVIGAATELMVRNFRSLLAEMRGLDGAKQALVRKCAAQAAEFADAGKDGKKVPEQLARMKALLAAVGDDGKMEYVYDLLSWIDGVDSTFVKGCHLEVKAFREPNKLLPTINVMYRSILVVEYLVSGYTFSP